jgi:hypothetical protein
MARAARVGRGDVGARVTQKRGAPATRTSAGAPMPAILTPCICSKTSRSGSSGSCTPAQWGPGGSGPRGDLRRCDRVCAPVAVRRTLASSASSSPSRATAILRRLRRRRPVRTEVRAVRVAGGGFPSGTPPSLVRRGASPVSLRVPAWRVSATLTGRFDVGHYAPANGRCLRGRPELIRLHRTAHSASRVPLMSRTADSSSATARAS